MNQHERDELVNYRIAKAKTTLEEVKLHIENELWNTAINRPYYACYYAVIALLLDKGIQPKTHTGVRQMFGLHFVQKGIVSKEDGRFFSDLYDRRQTGDYDDFINYDESTVIQLYIQADEFIKRILKLISER